MNKAKDRNQHVAKAILKVRQDHKLSQEQFAEKLGVTRQAVSRWEMGISVPNINTVLLISEKFDISVDAMLKAADEDEKGEGAGIFSHKDIKYGYVFLVIGILGLVSLPLAAKWLQIRNMELFKTAYEHSYDYLFEYPLSVIFLLALLFTGFGIYSVIKKKAAPG